MALLSHVNKYEKGRLHTQPFIKISRVPDTIYFTAKNKGKIARQLQPRELYQTLPIDLHGSESAAHNCPACTALFAQRRQIMWKRGYWSMFFSWLVFFRVEILFISSSLISSFSHLASFLLLSEIAPSYARAKRIKKSTSETFIHGLPVANIFSASHRNKNHNSKFPFRKMSFEIPRGPRLE